MCYFNLLQKTGQSFTTTATTIRRNIAWPIAKMRSETRENVVESGTSIIGNIRTSCKTHIKEFFFIILTKIINFFNVVVDICLKIHTNIYIVAKVNDVKN